MPTFADCRLLVFTAGIPFVPFCNGYKAIRQPGAGIAISSGQVPITLRKSALLLSAIVGAACGYTSCISVSIERIPASREWIEAFCSQADPYNAAMARFMFETAARIDQAISIEPDDLRPETFEVRIKAQKGHAESWIAVSPEMMAELEALQPQATQKPENRATPFAPHFRPWYLYSRTGFCRRARLCRRRALSPAGERSACDQAGSDLAATGSADRKPRYPAHIDGHPPEGFGNPA